MNGTSVPGDIWACLRDRADVDLQSDGCVRVVTDKAAGSEPTGFIFDGSGARAYVNIQHSPDNPNTALNESSFDEMLVIDGFTPDSATKLASPRPATIGPVRHGVRTVSPAQQK